MRCRPKADLNSTGALHGALRRNAVLRGGSIAIKGFIEIAPSLPWDAEITLFLCCFGAPGGRFRGPPPRQTALPGGYL
jgi:hypothetical protein